MNKTFNFISGLPRAGSTLLSSILNQNPRFSASIQDPLSGVINLMTTEFSHPRSNILVPPEKRKRVIKGLFDNYYEDTNKEVIFNSSRFWGESIHIIKDIYPDSKILMCVRDLGWILDSFELLYRKYPYSVPQYVTPQENHSMYTRASALLGDAMIGYPVVCLKTALYSEHKSSVMLVEYNDLCKNPKLMMKNIYGFIGEEEFTHDFDNVAVQYDDYDAHVMPGLHTVRKKVEFKQRQTILPPDIWDMVRGSEFWRKK